MMVGVESRSKLNNVVPACPPLGYVRQKESFIEAVAKVPLRYEKRSFVPNGWHYRSSPEAVIGCDGLCLRGHRKPGFFRIYVLPRLGGRVAG